MFLTVLLFLKLFIFVQYVLSTDYSLSIASISNCELPAEQYDQHNRVGVTIAAYRLRRGAARLKTNLSVTHRIDKIHFTVETFEVRENREHHTNTLTISCGHPLMRTVIAFLQVNTTSSCDLLSGEYRREDLDIDMFAPFMYLMWKSGRYGSIFQARTSAGIIACQKFLVDYHRKH